MGAFEYTGGSLFGYKKDRDVDEFERREQLRTQWRTSGEQTLAELGEGRGTLAWENTLPCIKYGSTNFIVIRNLRPRIPRETTRAD